MKNLMENLVELEVNDPVMYLTHEMARVLPIVFLSGHFAGYDSDGYPYVFSEGGTSFTRSASQIIKCQFVSALTVKSDEAYKLEKYQNLLEDLGANVSCTVSPIGPMLVTNSCDLDDCSRCDGDL